MQQKPDLGREPIGRLILRLALPTILAQVVNLLYNMVDRIYLARIPDVGTNALTGVGLCSPLIIIISAFTALAAMGGAPQAAIALGRRDQVRAERILGACATLLGVISLVLTLVMLFFHQPLLIAFGANADTLPYAAQYMLIYSLGTAFVQFTMGLNAFITTQGFSRVSMLTVLIGAVLNALLDPLFIFVFGMGVQGAALATILSQGVSFLFVLKFLTGPKTTLHLRRENLRLDWKLLGPCVALGLSPFIMQVTESAIAICFNTSLQRYGGTIAVSTMTLCTSIMQLATLPLSGLTQGAQPILSFNFGAGNFQRLKAAFRLLLMLCAGYMLTMVGLVEITPQTFISIFTPDQALQHFAAPYIRLYMAGMSIFGIQMACQQTFVAIGNAKCSLFLACLRKLILLIPLVFILPGFFEDKVFAVFLAEPVSDVISVVTTSVLFSIVFTRTIKRLEHAQGDHA